MDKNPRIFISVSEAEEIIAASTGRMPTEDVRFDEALGRALAQEVVASDLIPPFDNSAMDGFAVRSADIHREGTSLSVVSEIPAGVWSDRAVREGECARIMTGAPMPEGADTVVPVEQTEEISRDRIVINTIPEHRDHVRFKGEDVRPGQVVMRLGDPVTPPAVGMLATLGVTRIKVYCVPTVAVIATGDELVDPSQDLQIGKIRNSNGPALSAQAQALGCHVWSPMIARDDEHHTEACIRAASNADVIIISGGVSVGEHDHVKDALERSGFELLFWKVRQKPGKPLVFGRKGDTLVFGLPGNPVSSSVCFERYVRPALLRKMGYNTPERALEPAVLAEPIRKKSGLHHFVRGKVAFSPEGLLTTCPTGPQGSNLYSSVIAADCLIHLPEDMEDPPRGTSVSIERLLW